MPSRMEIPQQTQAQTLIPKFHNLGLRKHKLADTFHQHREGNNKEKSTISHSYNTTGNRDGAMQEQNDIIKVTFDSSSYASLDRSQAHTVSNSIETKKTRSASTMKKRNGSGGGRRKKVIYNLSGVRTDRIARSCEENNRALDTSYRFDTIGHGSSLHDDFANEKINSKQRNATADVILRGNMETNSSATNLFAERSNSSMSNKHSILNNSNKSVITVEGVPYDSRVIENRLSEDQFERLPGKMDSKKNFNRDEHRNVTTAPGKLPIKNSHSQSTGRRIGHYNDGMNRSKENSHRPFTVMSTGDIYRDQKDIANTIVGRVYSGAWSESNFHNKSHSIENTYKNGLEIIQQKFSQPNYYKSSYPSIAHLSEQNKKPNSDNIAEDTNVDPEFNAMFRSRQPSSRRDVILLRRNMLAKMNTAASKDQESDDESMYVDELSFSLLDILNETMSSLIQQVAIHCQERGQLLREVWNMSIDVMDSVIESRDKHIEVLNSQVMELTLDLENTIHRFDESQVGKIDAMNKVLLEQNDELKLDCANLETKNHQFEQQLQQIKMKGMMAETMREIAKEKNTSLEDNVRQLEKEVRHVENRMNAAMSSLESELMLEKELRQNAERRAAPELPDDIRGEMHKEITKKLNNAVTWLDTVRSFKVIERVKDMPSRELVTLIERGELPETVEERLGLDILQLDTNANNETSEGSWMTSSRARRKSSIHNLVNNNQKVFDRYLNQLRQRMDMKNAELDYLRVRVEKQQEKLSNRKKVKEQHASSFQSPSSRNLLTENRGTNIERKYGFAGDDFNSSVQRVSKFVDSYGTSNQVPKFLRNSNNKVRNRALTRLNAEQLVIQILLERQQTAGKLDGSIDYTSANSIRLSEYVYNFLRQRYGVLSMIHEWGYSLIDACQRFIGESGLLFLFKQMTFNEISENTYFNIENFIKNFIIKLDEHDYANTTNTNIINNNHGYNTNKTGFISEVDFTNLLVDYCQEAYILPRTSRVANSRSKPLEGNEYFIRLVKAINKDIDKEKGAIPYLQMWSDCYDLSDFYNTDDSAQSNQPNNSGQTQQATVVSTTSSIAQPSQTTTGSAPVLTNMSFVINELRMILTACHATFLGSMEDELIKESSKVTGYPDSDVVNVDIAFNGINNAFEELIHKNNGDRSRSNSPGKSDENPNSISGSLPAVFLGNFSPLQVQRLVSCGFNKSEMNKSEKQTDVTKIVMPCSVFINNIKLNGDSCLPSQMTVQMSSLSTKSKENDNKNVSENHVSTFKSTTRMVMFGSRLLKARLKAREQKQ